MADKYWNHNDSSTDNYLHWIEEELTDLHHTIKELSNVYTGVQVFNSLQALNNISPNHDVIYADGKYEAVSLTVHHISYKTPDPVAMHNWLIRERYNVYDVR